MTEPPPGTPRTVEQLAAELAAAQTRIDELTAELDATNRGIIALHTDLEAARAAEARAAAEQEVAAERDRIAAELRDQVIRKVFAAGLSLEGATGLIQNKVAAGRVRAVVADLDAVIAQLRAAVFGAEEREQPAAGLRLRLNELAGEAHQALGYSTSLELRGPIDETVPVDLATALLGAVQSVLMGSAATATMVAIQVEADGELSLLVDYDGPAPAAGDLDSLIADARSHGGVAEIESTGSGTRLVWRVPLPERS